MRSSNPVFSRRGFSRDNGYAGFNAAPQAGGPAVGTQANPYAQGNQYAQGGNPYAQNPYAQQDLQHGAPPQAPVSTGRMTMDDVVMRSAMTLGTVTVGAILAWALLPVSSTSYGLAIGAALVAFVLAMVQSFKRTASPALILGYAAFEGVFLGVISEMYNSRWSGAPFQAVLGTMAVSGATLLVYKAGWIRVTARYARIGMTIAIAFVVVTAVNLLLVVFGVANDGGLRSMGPLGAIVGILAILIGAFFLTLDFKQIEDGIAYGAPKEEAWLAAFGLTMTLVWIYIEMLRLVAIFSGDD
ncbi:Bax inhibitor-1/YccA family protein [Streptomyces sp. NBC_01340]|uniref:Bax inhibitor-1/YccA family protein n=1 Tax=unclassified Streptomyces TaxID=2593676 RepID=UPI002251ABFE|nr:MULTISPECIES: Bax inhibitor-1/YccA family protein [unclassified Streptomyces]MCX4454601.1 Bax inhibitor-1/YccA family protein [Streptomyces sp. NBC_01719]MCX4493961.1 Bax inhibitor-1/YccA family protein [Streptomyces sp. NBC_01728]WSI39043.1 Bax inhibitor-1/YccA family protein [Streptomyces sp. NBC_01340]